VGVTDHSTRNDPCPARTAPPSPFQVEGFESKSIDNGGKLGYETTPSFPAAINSRINQKEWRSLRAHPAKAGAP
jgi:hypothetical protein